MRIVDGANRKIADCFPRIAIKDRVRFRVRVMIHSHILGLVQQLLAAEYMSSCAPSLETVMRPIKSATRVSTARFGTSPPRNGFPHGQRHRRQNKKTEKFLFFIAVKCQKGQLNRRLTISPA